MEYLSHTFEEALSALKVGHKVFRTGWNMNKILRADGDNYRMYAQMQVPDEHSKMGKPYLYIVPSEDAKVPWFPSTDDLFAEDWFILED